MSKLLGLVFLLLAFHSFGQQANIHELKEYPNLPYLSPDKVENDTLQRLNLVLPVGVETPPLLVWIGGGAWSYVNRNMEMDLARKVAKEGIAVAAVGHRLSSAVWRDSTMSEGVQHPQHIKDIASSFKWLYDHASEYGYDPENIFVGGFSSGAHLTALLGLDLHYLEDQGLTGDLIKGLIPIGGTYDISDYHRVFAEGRSPNLAVEHVEAVFGETKNDWIEASPNSYLDNLSIPILLISENNTYQYASIFEEQVLETGFREFQALHLHQIGHGDLWRHLSYENESTFRNYIIQFIRDHQTG